MVGNAERAIQDLKKVMLKLAEDFPDASPTQLRAMATGAHNELDRIRHYSPNQWAFGRSRTIWTGPGDLASAQAHANPNTEYGSNLQVRLAAEAEYDQAFLTL